MIFTNKKNHTYIHNVLLGGTNLEQIKNTKLLGITIDDKLTFSKHIKKVTAKVSFVCHIISKLYFLPKEVLKKIYYAYANSIITYGIGIYGNAYKCHISKLKKMQKTIIKKISKVKEKT